MEMCVKQVYRRSLLFLLAGCLLLLLSGAAIAEDAKTAKPVAELYVTSW